MVVVRKTLMFLLALVMAGAAFSMPAVGQPVCSGPAGVRDTDGDGDSDCEELQAGSDPNNANSTVEDRDGDSADCVANGGAEGCSDNAIEAAGCSNSEDPDTDADGFSDGAEYGAGSDPCNPRCTPEDVDCDTLRDSWENQHFGDLSQGPTDDPDGDGAANFWEMIGRCDPNDTDTDDDGLSDYEIFPVKRGGYHTRCFKQDTDGDGYTDKEEVDEGTDPTDPRCNPADHDCDGYSDTVELAAGSDPYDYHSTPLDYDADGVPYAIDQFVDTHGDRRYICDDPVAGWYPSQFATLRKAILCPLYKIQNIPNPASDRGATVYNVRVDSRSPTDPASRAFDDSILLSFDVRSDMVTIYLGEFRDPTGGRAPSLNQGIGQTISVPIGSGVIPLPLTVNVPILSAERLRFADADNDGMPGLYAQYNSWHVNDDGTMSKDTNRKPYYGQIAGPDPDDDDNSRRLPMD